jgi:hypothetical protein
LRESVQFAAVGGAFTDIEPPLRPFRTAITSARMLSAISSGERPPTSRPMGLCTRHPLELFGSHPQPLQPLQPLSVRAPASDGPHVEGAGVESNIQGGVVDLGVVRQNGDGAPAVNPQLRHCLFRPLYHDLIRLRKALAVGETGAWIDNRDPESKGFGHPDERDGRVNGADDDQVGWGKEGLNQHLGGGWQTQHRGVVIFVPSRPRLP